MITTKKLDRYGIERTIMTNTGGKSQSVNFCTPAGVQGQYEGVEVRFIPAFFVNEAWFAKYATYEAVIEALSARNYRQCQRLAVLAPAPVALPTVAV